jgi:Holliday junction resolvase
MILKLPYPISTNRYWRTFRNRTVRSAEAQRYKEHVANVALATGERKIDGDVTVKLFLHPKKTKAGQASKTCIDLDNSLKVVLDALNGIAYHDDKQIKRIVAETSYSLENGGVTVEVTG